MPRALGGITRVKNKKAMTPTRLDRTIQYRHLMWQLQECERLGVDPDTVIYGEPIDPPPEAYLDENNCPIKDDSRALVSEGKNNLLFLSDFMTFSRLV